jgi:hypothetical protein
VAYHITGFRPVAGNFQALLHWLTPVSLPSFSQNLVLWLAAATVGIAFFGAWSYRRISWLMVLPAFCMEEMLRLVATGETFEPRYFVPLMWALMILFGLGVRTIWTTLSGRFRLKPILGCALLAGYVGISLWFSFEMAQLVKAEQFSLFDSSRKQVGLWLAANTPASATVFLEPLGYIGYYANRRMIDEVGLVSWQVVDLKKKGYATFDLILALDPDLAVLHCDDALGAPDAFRSRYSKVVEFNPLGFDPTVPLNYDPDASDMVNQPIDIQRLACYQVWKK